MPKRAVLLVNLGSPDSTSVPDVRRYLREFLGDERVLDLPAAARWLLLEGIILRTRPKKSAHAYSEIWQPDGSPLIITSKSVQKKLAAKLGAETPVYLAMRYGNPSTPAAIRKLVEWGADRILLFPMYPQYSAATTGSRSGSSARRLASSFSPTSPAAAQRSISASAWSVWFGFTTA